MTADEKVSALLKESQTLTPGKDSARLCEIYTEAAALVDRNEKPKKWAAFRWMYGQAADQLDPLAALAAYRESLPCWDPVADREQWASCKSSIGWALASLGKVSPPESEEVIECLEAAIDEFPYGASLLATYYSARTIGDPLENWKKRLHYLELALSQVSAKEDPVQWATLTNALAVSLPQEPDGEFAKATETRIEFHKKALAVLETAKEEAGSAAQNRWIMICVDTSEAYLSRVRTDRADDLKTAEQYARDAYQACGPQVAKDTRTFATMALARALLNEDGAAVEGLKLCAEADLLINARLQPVVAATNQKFKALAHLKLLELGDASQLAGLLAAADSAYSLLDPALYSDMRRTVMQLAADGLIAAGEFVRSTNYLQRAVEAGESNLQQATTRAGRLERIFDLHDSYARLAYCLFQAGEIGKGIEALDSGKGRWWKPGKSFATFEQSKTLIPKSGALLFPTFAPKDGAVAIVTEQGERVCPLKGFGQERLKELLLGDIRNPEGNSWIGRYVFRHANPARWRDAIDSIGGVLFALLWQPLLEVLDSLGVREGAELVVFPQAGLGVLPLHAAWKDESEGRRWISDCYAIRYAPSASCLLEKQGAITEGGTLFVSDPVGDLPNSALELAWVREAEPAEKMTVLVGGDAQRARVLSELPHTGRAHFSTHAVFRVDDPFQSSLVMANGELLSLGQLLPVMEHSALREVVLSGCETAMSQVARRPDEFLGFPAAFLEHGVATVIATQWPVDDWAAAAMVGRFYKEWRKPSGVRAAQAMRATQQWMREVTAGDLLVLLLPLKQDPGPSGAQAAMIRTSLRKFDGKARPFAHPYFWAGFTVSGF
jgi:CHAT domain-containing protein/tetratricopeptide (TPR) repeat protein